MSELRGLVNARDCVHPAARIHHEPSGDAWCMDCGCWTHQKNPPASRAALSAARDEVVRAAVALAPDIAREHDDGDGYRTVSLDSAEAAAFCAAVAALARLEAK